jgi:hypothetical protein
MMLQDGLRELHLAGAEAALNKIIAHARHALAEVQDREVPSGSLTELVTEYDRHVTALAVLDAVRQR